MFRHKEVNQAVTVFLVSIIVLTLAGFIYGLI
jgi:hypothetical protein